MKALFASLLGMFLSTTAFAFQENWSCTSLKKNSALPSLQGTVDYTHDTAFGAATDKDLQLSLEDKMPYYTRKLFGQIQTSSIYREYKIQLLPQKDEDMDPSMIGKKVKGQAVAIITTFKQDTGTTNEIEIYDCKVELTAKSRVPNK